MPQLILWCFMFWGAVFLAKLGTKGSKLVHKPKNDRCSLIFVRCFKLRMASAVCCNNASRTTMNTWASFFFILENNLNFVNLIRTPMSQRGVRTCCTCWIYAFCAFRKYHGVIKCISPDRRRIVERRKWVVRWNVTGTLFNSSSTRMNCSSLICAGKSFFTLCALEISTSQWLM